MNVENPSRWWKFLWPKFSPPFCRYFFRTATKFENPSQWFSNLWLQTHISDFEIQDCRPLIYVWNNISAVMFPTQINAFVAESEIMIAPWKTDVIHFFVWKRFYLLLGPGQFLGEPIMLCRVQKWNTRPYLWVHSKKINKQNALSAHVGRPRPRTMPHAD